MSRGPDPRDARIAELEAENAALQAEVAALKARLAVLEARHGQGSAGAPASAASEPQDPAALRAERDALKEQVAALQARLGQNSTNSSKPPSSDPPGVKRAPKKKRSGRKPGGQPGHPGHHRELLPPEKVTRVRDHYPPACSHCHRHLPQGNGRQEVGEPTRHQVTTVPEIVPDVTEHRCHTLHCVCGHDTTATLPPDVPLGVLGPRLQAIIALFSGVYQLSKREVEQAVADLFGVQISLGTVSRTEQRVSTTLATPYQEAHDLIQDQGALNVDETGWTENRRRAWVWVAVAAAAGVAVFRIHWSRGKQAAHELLGRFSGYLMSDRWCAYERHPLGCRQLCWAHLARHFLAMGEYSGEVGRIGKELTRLARRMFRWWNQVRDGRMKRADFQRKMKPLRSRVERLILQGAHTSVRPVRGMCWQLDRLSAAMWTFVDVEGIEPTNNEAERALRRLVLWRKSSFGTHSERGSRFVERMMTVALSLRLQNRNVLDFLVEAMEASLKHQPLPSLVPRPDAHDHLPMAA